MMRLILTTAQAFMDISITYPANSRHQDITVTSDGDSKVTVEVYDGAIIPTQDTVVLVEIDID